MLELYSNKLIGDGVVSKGEFDVCTFKLCTSACYIWSPLQAEKDKYEDVLKTAFDKSNSQPILNRNWLDSPWEGEA